MFYRRDCEDRISILSPGIPRRSDLEPGVLRALCALAVSVPWIPGIRCIFGARCDASLGRVIIEPLLASFGTSSFPVSHFRVRNCSNRGYAIFVDNTVFRSGQLGP